MLPAELQATLHPASQVCFPNRIDTLEFSGLFSLHSMYPRFQISVLKST